MAFKARLTGPEMNNLYYIKKESGGYNPCISGSPLSDKPRPKGSCLPNCFTGDTKIQTDKGVFPLKKLEGLQIKIPTMDGVMRDATVSCFGKQKIYEVHLQNGSVYKCSGNHRWVIFDDDRINWHIVETVDLVRGMAIRYSKYNLFIMVDHIKETRWTKKVYCAVEPETHMMTLENGELTGNCVGYAHGRFLEIMGATSCKLGHGNAKTWYSYGDGYPRGQTPRLGAVCCWSHSKWGHVAIVEQIKSDGTIVTSNSAWPNDTSKPGTYFYTKELKPPYSFGNYTFQGFIYNPGGGQPTNKVSNFTQTALEHIKDYASFIASQLGGYRTTEPWSCKYVMACAKKNDLLGKAIPMSNCPSDIGKNAEHSKIGSWITSKTSPKVGDLMMLRTKIRQEYSTYECDKVAIVLSVKNNNTVHVVEGDSEGKVKERDYNKSDKKICAYYRPKWEAVQDSSEDGDIFDVYGAAGAVQPLYTTMCTKEDAIVREFGYIDENALTVAKVSNIRVSVINYTTALSGSAMSGVSIGGADLSSIGTDNSNTVSLDAMQNQNCKIIVQFLLSKGLNAAASIAIAANIKHESSFNPESKGDYQGGVPTSFGICQWHYERGTAMKSMAGSDWANNLTGQLNYLWYELNGSYKDRVLAKLVTVSNTEQGAREAADVFVRKFEVPANIDRESQSRQNTASALWKQISIIMK